GGSQVRLERSFEPEAEPSILDEGLPRRFLSYELLELVGRGGMGIVYRARQTGLSRSVAVKLMLSYGRAQTPEVRTRFKREAEAIASLRHPNIVAIHEFGEHDGRPFFSMDFVQGVSLAELTRSGPISALRSARYTKTIAEAVAYAHG